MIRDPSDGSVKEITPSTDETNPLPADPSSEGIASGLQTGSKRPGEIERLNRSREWLKNYHQKGQ